MSMISKSGSRASLANRMENKLPDPTGQRVIILAGPYDGHEGVCLGRAGDGTGWMVSPDGTNEIIRMEFDKEFGILQTRDN
jgi:hypothetical protein